MVIQCFLPLHLNPGGVDYEDFIQQSMSLDFTFNNLHKKVMKMVFQSTMNFYPLSLLLLSHFPPPFPSLYPSPSPSPLCFLLLLPFSVPSPSPNANKYVTKSNFFMYVLSIPYQKMSVYCVMFYLLPLPKRSVGPIQQCTTISIISDDLVENAETFHLLLSTMDEGVILSPARAYVTITDNDGQLLIYLPWIYHSCILKSAIVILYIVMITGCIGPYL